MARPGHTPWPPCTASVAGTCPPETSRRATATTIGISTTRTHHHHHGSVGAAEAAVHIAERYLGVRYVYGGESPSGFDCSGLVQYAYAKAGIEIPRTTYSQYGIGEPVSRSELQPGDLLFFDHVGHVGMYVGGGRFIHAPHTGTVVQFGTLSGWYLQNFVGARRVVG